MSKNSEFNILYEAFECIKVEWNMKNLIDLPEDSVPLESPDFMFSNAVWKLATSIDNKATSDWLIMLICQRKSPSEHHVAGTIGIKKADDAVITTSFCRNPLFGKEEEGWALSYFFYLSKMELLKADNAVTVYCTIRLGNSSCENKTTAVQTSSKSPNSVETLSQNFEELLLSGCQNDVKIKVKSKEFRTHKLILSARSPVFRAMFENDMLEKKSDGINIEDCDPESFGNFLLFLYSGKSNVVSSTNASSLYVTADKYDIKDLKEECSKCLTREISVDTVCDVIHMALLYDESEMLRLATEYFVTNADTVLNTPKWQTFLVEHPASANELFIKAIKKYKK